MSRNSLFAITAAALALAFATSAEISLAQRSTLPGSLPDVQPQATKENRRTRASRHTR